MCEVQAMGLRGPNRILAELDLWSSHLSIYVNQASKVVREVCLRWIRNRVEAVEIWTLLELTELKTWRVTYRALAWDSLNSENRKVCVPKTSFSHTPFVAVSSQLRKDGRSRTDVGSLNTGNEVQVLGS